VAGSNGTASLALAATATEGPPGGGTDSAAPTRAEGAEFRPQLTLPLRSAGVRPAWYWAILIALASGLVVAAVVAPVVGLAIGALVLLGLLVSWSRGIALIGAIGLVVATGVYMVTRQRRYGFVPDINWPAHFPRADTLAWLAICVLAADAVVIAVRHRPAEDRRRRRKADAADEPSRRRRRRATMSPHCRWNLWLPTSPRPVRTRRAPRQRISRRARRGRRAHPGATGATCRDGGSARPSLALAAVAAPSGPLTLLQGADR